MTHPIPKKPDDICKSCVDRVVCEKAGYGMKECAGYVKADVEGDFAQVEDVAAESVKLFEKTGDCVVHVVPASDAPPLELEDLIGFAKMHGAPAKPGIRMKLNASDFDRLSELMGCSPIIHIKEILRDIPCEHPTGFMATVFPNGSDNVIHHPNDPRPWRDTDTVKIAEAGPTQIGYDPLSAELIIPSNSTEHGRLTMNSKHPGTFPASDAITDGANDGIPVAEPGPSFLAAPAKFRMTHDNVEYSPTARTRLLAKLDCMLAISRLIWWDKADTERQRQCDRLMAEIQDLRKGCGE
jgi:hypothetical protein